MAEPLPGWVMEPKREPNVWEALSRKAELDPDGTAARLLERHHPELLLADHEEEPSA